MEMLLQGILVAVALAGGSFFIGYVVREYWLLLAPVGGCACFFAIAAAIVTSGDGGAEAVIGISFVLGLGALVLGAPSMLVGIVWGRTKSQTKPNGQTK
jgi:hypothetical protein